MDVSRIKFGTDGWRGVIAEEFTFDNVRACAQGVALYQKEQGAGGRPLVVGYDTRFGSEEFAAAVAEVLAGNGIPVLLADNAVPTPVTSYNIVARKAAAGVVITASHNPARWNGFKYRTAYGGSPAPEALKAIEGHIASLRRPDQVMHLPMDEARRRGMVEMASLGTPYLEHLATLLELGGLQRAGLKVVVDAMHGAGAGYFAGLLEGDSTTVREVRADRNPLFPNMHNPEPVARNLEALVRAVRRGKAQVGLALDGDADRLGVVDDRGQFVTPLQVYALLALYLLEVRGERGPIVKTVTSTSMAWGLGQRFGVPVLETGVGFKYIAPLMVQERALMGGEESGGYGFRGHIPERDGILSGLFILDLMARTGKTLPQLIDHLYDLVGPHHYGRQDVPLEPASRPEIEQRAATAQPERLAGVAVARRDTLDGLRFVLEGGAWLALRFSGTEPLLRIYAEAESPQRAQELLTEGRRLLGLPV
jgi:alpha-D-glucose phosphate-specific phosphoglucomutase